MIINELEDSSIKSLTGKEKWSKRTIQKILINEKYIGNVILGKTYTDTYTSSKQRVNNGAQDKYLMENNHETIISIGVFEKVQEEISITSNIEMVDGKVKRKNTHYSPKSNNLMGEYKSSRFMRAFWQNMYLCF
ncbi:recombinase [Clostridium sporogenes]|nr:recombinase [Clostridium sporogenes]